MKLSCDWCKNYKAKYQPRNGCQGCWNKFFETNKLKTHSLIFAYETYGRELAVKARGEKHIEHFEEWLKTRKKDK